MFNEKLSQMVNEMTNCLCDILRIESYAQAPEEGKPNGPGVAKALDHVMRIANRMGFSGKTVDGYYGFVEYCGDGEACGGQAGSGDRKDCAGGIGKEMIAVLGHLDTVPTCDGWANDPYAAIIEDGNIYGRGAMDNKGPTIAALYALKAIKDSGVPLSRRIRLIFGTSEETTFTDMTQYAEREELPVAGFTPDSDFPVIHAEKGLIKVLFSRQFDELEDADISLLSLRGGTAMNSVPDKAEAVLAINKPHANRQLRLVSAGLSAHASMPDAGRNAYFALLDLLSHQDLPIPMQDAFSYLAHAFGQETRGENLGIAVSDEASGPLTLNLGLLEGEGDLLKGGVDIRYPVTASKDEILQNFEASLTKGGFGIDSIAHVPPLYEPKDSWLAQTLARVFNEQTGLGGGPISTGGGTYARALPNVLAFGPRFPGEKNTFHQPNEHIPIQKLLQLSQIYAQAMYELAK